MGLTFKVYKGDELVTTETFDREIIKIGRLSSAHLRLDDEKVSRIHAVVEIAANGEVNIIDMGSAEGTFVNGEKTNKATLKPGDELRLGDTRIVFQEIDGAPAAASAEAPAVAAAASAETAPTEAGAETSGAEEEFFGVDTEAATRVEEPPAELIEKAAALEATAR